jgi:S-(hydroxymethyl)glutathione dehydrogenase / alcohol dehydrogenase
MKASVFYAPDQPLKIQEIDIDDPHGHEVLVRIIASGVCHSDLHIVEGKMPFPGPIILGHEPAGIVEKVGEHVTEFKPGDHVIARVTVYCGHCTMCLSGAPNQCINRVSTQRKPDERPRMMLGGKKITGLADGAGFAEKMLVHEHALVTIDKSIPLDKASLIGCGVMTGAGAVFNTAKVQPATTVAVFGAGGIGLSAIQAARIAGARRIIAVDIAENKLAIARRLGATHTVDASSSDPVAEIRKLSDGGVDFSFEAVGTKQTAEAAIGCLAVRGTATLIGLLPAGQSIEFQPTFMISGERKVQGCLSGSTRWRIDAPRLVELYQQGRLNLDDMVTRHGRLEDLNEAFRAMKAGEVVRTILMFPQ